MPTDEEPSVIVEFKTILATFSTPSSVNVVPSQINNELPAILFVPEPTATCVFAMLPPITPPPPRFACTYAVVAMALRSSDVAGVGAVGDPVNPGDANGAKIDVTMEPVTFPNPSNSQFTTLDPTGVTGVGLLRFGPVTGFPFYL